MCPVKQFALTHVVIFVLCACNAADRLVCAMRAFFIRREDAPPQQAENGQYRVFCYFKGGAERNFELFAMELDPQGDYTSAGHLAQAQEYIYVLEGRLTVETGGGVYHLDPGDALGFDSTKEHRYRNQGEVLVRGLILNYYPE